MCISEYYSGTDRVCGRSVFYGSSRGTRDDPFSSQVEEEEEESKEPFIASASLGSGDIPIHVPADEFVHMHYSTANVQPSAAHVQPTSPHVQPSPAHVQPTTARVQPTTEADFSSTSSAAEHGELERAISSLTLKSRHRCAMC